MTLSRTSSEVLGGNSPPVDLGRPMRTASLPIPGGYRMETEVFICTCVRTVIYTEDGDTYKSGLAACRQHGGSPELSETSGQTDMFGFVPPKKKKRSKKR